jgi:hypothetical protein
VADGFVQSLVEIIPPHLHKEMELELIHGWRKKEAYARAEAKQIAHFGHTHEANDIAGLGRKIITIGDSDSVTIVGRTSNLCVSTFVTTPNSLSAIIVKRQ